MLIDEVKKYLGPGGALSRSMPSYEFRPQQLEMAESVARAFEEGFPAMVEAGTGTGKSLAYLTPAVLWAVANNKKVVVSTYTKTLQQQILNQDIPLLREKLGLSFRYAVCLGHENYLSLRRLKRASQTGMFTRPEEDAQLRAIFDWAGETAAGIKSELPFEPLPSVWEDVGRQKDLCMGKNCETYESCFYFKERRKWFSSHILVVNHHLFFANVAGNGAVLPRFDAVIFDEAQNVEEAATAFLGLEISNLGLTYYLDRLHNPKTRKGALGRIDPAPMHLYNLVAQTRRAAESFFANVFETYGRSDRTVRFYQPPPLENVLQSPMEELHESLKTLEGQLTSEAERLEVASAAARCSEYNAALQSLLDQRQPDYVYWLEVSGRKRGPRAVLCGVPVNVAGTLNREVFGKIERVTMTSATLAAGKGFDFIKNRIGFEPREEKILDSPFDYSTQALLYLPADLPEPGDKTARYIESISARARELILAAGGRTFILFTSYDALNRVYLELEPLSRQFRLLKQGDLPTGQMIERFKEVPSVIFGTNSFWQGVDIPGEALTSVIIVKLPFDVPTDPLTEARLEDLRRRSINPFRHYQIPRAVIQLKQGFGRLIRKKTDTGVVAILDTRLTRRSYGSQFIKALPPCRVTDDMEEVRSFLRKTGEKNVSPTSIGIGSDG
ncbi:MAG: ATP-dependent DNA helicase [Nitrospinae bacterium]|nr:ATP-dependent DNA helicase [Nitrospinota bacterium]